MVIKRGKIDISEINGRIYMNILDVSRFNSLLAILEKIRRLTLRFLWYGYKKKGISLVKWHRKFMPKVKGGKGLKNIHYFC